MEKRVKLQKWFLKEPTTKQLLRELTKSEKVNGFCLFKVFKMLLFYYLVKVSIATWLLNVLNLVLIVSTLLLMLKLFFKTPGTSNRSSHTRTDSTDHNYPKSFTKLVAGTATIFTLGKRREHLTGKQNISRPFWNMITLLQLFFTLKQLVRTSNGTILTSGKTDLLIQELQPTLNANVSREKLLLY